MSACLFCRIVAGEIPAQIVSETARTLAFRDIAPISPTHVLVIPKAHFDDLTHATQSELSLVGEVLAHGAQVAASEKLADGYRVVINTGPDGGQTVPHLHAHVLGGRSHAWPPG